jgi:hypothetical protein
MNDVIPFVTGARKRTAIATSDSSVVGEASHVVGQQEAMAADVGLPGRGTARSRLPAQVSADLSPSANRIHQCLQDSKLSLSLHDLNEPGRFLVTVQNHDRQVVLRQMSPELSLSLLMNLSAS